MWAVGQGQKAGPGDGCFIDSTWGPGFPFFGIGYSFIHAHRGKHIPTPMSSI